jgi:uncharacterized protein (TIGR02246 family)
MPARTPEEVDALFEKAMNAGDLEGLVALYEPEGTLVTGPDQEAKGTEEIRAALKGFLDPPPQIDLRVERTVPAGDALAACYGVWTMKAGGQELTGKSFEIVRRQPDGTWLFVIDDPWGRGG